MSESINPNGKTLKDYQPSPLSEARDVFASSTSESFERRERNPFDARGSSNSDASPEPSNGGETVSHQWKVTANSGVTSVSVSAGKVSTQGSFLPPFDVAGIGSLAASASGFVVLSIHRDSSTREITSGAISFATGSPNDSTESVQVIALAEVIVGSGEIADVIQLVFEELRIYEALVVSNGELELTDLRMASRTTYALPT